MTIQETGIADTIRKEKNIVAAEQAPWTPVQKYLFRVAFVFFLLLIIPLSPDWYQRLFSLQSPGAFFTLISGHRTNFLYIPTDSGRWGWLSYAATWGPALITAAAVALIWTALIRKKSVVNYNRLYYWLSVLIRYRIALGLIAFGYLKVFPMQMPFPSLSNLNTNFGDYSDYKLYWQSVGISQWYEIVLGYVEVLIGFCFFFRGLTATGAILAIGVLYNISHANLAYDGGVHVYSAYFVLLSAFLLIRYIPNLWRLFILEKDAEPLYNYPVFSTARKARILKTGKYIFITLFVFVSLYNRYHTHYVLKRLKEPVTQGLPNAAGYYNVTQFTINGETIPYSPVDKVRWQDVILEKYSTLTYKIFKPQRIDISNGGGGGDGDVSRNYELSGIAGGRKFFYYEADTVTGILKLQDKNTPKKYFDMYSRNFGAPLFVFSGGAEDAASRVKSKSTKPGKLPAEVLTWHFSRPSENRIIISGLNESRDSIYVVLDRLDKKYPLVEGRID